MYWNVAQKGKIIYVTVDLHLCFVLSVDCWIVDEVHICHKRLIFLMHKEPFQINQNKNPTI